MWVNNGSFQAPPGDDTSTPANGFWQANYGTGSFSLAAGAYSRIGFQDSTGTPSAGVTHTTGHDAAYISEGGVFLARAGFRTTGSTNSTGWTAYLQWGVTEGTTIYYRLHRMRSFQFPAQAAGAGGNIASEIIVRQEPGANVMPRIYSTLATTLNLTDSYFTIQRLARW